MVTSDRAAFFARGLAVAAIFHLAGNPRAGFVPESVVLPLAQVGVGVASVLVLLRPRRQLPLVLLCLLVPVSAWLESPVVGNHWVLATALCLGYLTALLAAHWRDRDADPTRTFALFAPVARVTLLIAYGFAAFAKLNTGFFDPATSCAVFYHDQLVDSWGLDAVSSAGRPALGTVVALCAAAVELSVPVLLSLRRARRIGVLLALGFHWMLALDLAQHFWDFSSVLFVGFLLFLDDGQVEKVSNLLRRLRASVRASVKVLTATLALVAVLVATAAASLSGPQGVVVGANLLGHAAWFVIGTGTLILVLVATRGSATPRDYSALRVARPVLLLMPILVAFNGVTPYLELKTGFGWNMYSNLRTVEGETNHLLIPATWDLTRLQEDQVEILASSDDNLARLVDSEHRVVYSEFREYAHENPDESVTYRRGGEVHEVDRLGDDPAAQGGVSAVSLRLQSFRVVSTSAEETCLDVFGPAR